MKAKLPNEERLTEQAATLLHTAVHRQLDILLILRKSSHARFLGGKLRMHRKLLSIVYSWGARQRTDGRVAMFDSV